MQGCNTYTAHFAVEICAFNHKCPQQVTPQYTKCCTCHAKSRCPVLSFRFPFSFPFCDLLFLLRFCSATLSLRYILCLYVTYPFLFLFNLSFCDFSFRLHAHSFSYFFFLIVLMIFESPMYRSEADQIKLPLEYSQNSC